MISSDQIPGLASQNTVIQLIHKEWSEILLSWLNKCVHPEKNITTLTSKCLSDIVTKYIKEICGNDVEKNIEPYIQSKYPELKISQLLEKKNATLKVYVLVSILLYDCCITSYKGSAHVDICDNLKKNEQEIILKFCENLNNKPHNLENVFKAIADAVEITNKVSNEKSMGPNTSKVTDNALTNPVLSNSIHSMKPNESPVPLNIAAPVTALPTMLNLTTSESSYYSSGKSVVRYPNSKGFAENKSGLGSPFKNAYPQSDSAEMKHKVAKSKEKFLGKYEIKHRNIFNSVKDTTTDNDGSDVNDTQNYDDDTANNDDDRDIEETTDVEYSGVDNMILSVDSCKDSYSVQSEKSIGSGVNVVKRPEKILRPSYSRSKIKASIIKDPVKEIRQDVMERGNEIPLAVKREKSGETLKASRNSSDTSKLRVSKNKSSKQIDKSTMDYKPKKSIVNFKEHPVEDKPSKHPRSRTPDGNETDVETDDVEEMENVKTKEKPRRFKQVIEVSSYGTAQDYDGLNKGLRSGGISQMITDPGDNREFKCVIKPNFSCDPTSRGEDYPGSRRGNIKLRNEMARCRDEYLGQREPECLKNISSEPPCVYSPSPRSLNSPRFDPLRLPPPSPPGSAPFSPPRSAPRSPTRSPPRTPPHSPPRYDPMRILQPPQCYVPPRPTETRSRPKMKQKETSTNISIRRPESKMKQDASINTLRDWKIGSDKVEKEAVCVREVSKKVSKRDANTSYHDITLTSKPKITKASAVPCVPVPAECKTASDKGIKISGINRLVGLTRTRMGMDDHGDKQVSATTSPQKIKGSAEVTNKCECAKRIVHQSVDAMERRSIRDKLKTFSKKQRLYMLISFVTFLALLLALIIALVYTKTHCKKKAFIEKQMEIEEDFDFPEETTTVRVRSRQTVLLRTEAPGNGRSPQNAVVRNSFIKPLYRSNPNPEKMASDQNWNPYQHFKPKYF